MTSMCSMPPFSLGTCCAVSCPICEDSLTYMHEGDRMRDFLGGYKTGEGIDKWTGYLDPYGRHLDRFRGQERVVLIEVGVQSGGSIRMWQDYFGKDKLRYVGIDIDSKTRSFARPGVEIVIGDQADPGFWRDFKAKYPVADIFLDDGGHSMSQQTTTFREMFWHVRDGGIYICEDLHTSYWPEWGGGYKRADTMVELGKSLLDVIHAWHSQDRGLEVNDYTRNIRGLHFYDSMIFIDKLETQRSGRIRVGDRWIPYPPDTTRKRAEM